MIILYSIFFSVFLILLTYIFLLFASKPAPDHSLAPTTPKHLHKHSVFCLVCFILAVVFYSVLFCVVNYNKNDVPGESCCMISLQ